VATMVRTPNDDHPFDLEAAAASLGLEARDFPGDVDREAPRWLLRWTREGAAIRGGGDRAGRANLTLGFCDRLPLNDFLSLYASLETRECLQALTLLSLEYGGFTVRVWPYAPTERPADLAGPGEDEEAELPPSGWAYAVHPTRGEGAPITEFGQHREATAWNAAVAAAHRLVLAHDALAAPASWREPASDPEPSASPPRRGLLARLRGRA